MYFEITRRADESSASPVDWWRANDGKGFPMIDLLAHEMSMGNWSFNP